MQIVKYNPLNDLRKMEHDLDKFWDKGWDLPAVFASAGVIDMYEEDGKLIIEASLPNFTKEEVTVTTDNGVLEISAEHKEKEEKKTKRRYHLRESSNQYFRRAVLPEGIDADQAKADLKDGILKITMPIEAKRQAKAIEIK